MNDPILMRFYSPNLLNENEQAFAHVHMQAVLAAVVVRVVVAESPGRH
jgi:hypothetical protein